jgi:hypothetical protein
MRLVWQFDPKSKSLNTLAPSGVSCAYSDMDD